MPDEISEWRAVERHDKRTKKASRPKKKELHKTGGGNMNRGTLYLIVCPECSTTGENVAWHGWNNYYECPNCSEVIKLGG